MGTISGVLVQTFAEADYGLLDGVSMNAPYDFHWVIVTSVEDGELLCTGGGKPMRLPIRQTPTGERATVKIDDFLFGEQAFEVFPLRKAD